jgi:hypothetical protein
MQAEIFSAYQNLKRTFNSSLFALQKIIKDMQAPQEQRIYGTVRHGGIGPVVIFVDVTMNTTSATSVQVTKTAFYPGAATITAGQKVLLSVGSNGKLIATPV